MHFAAWDGHDSVVQRLLEAKAAVDAKDQDGRALGGNVPEAQDGCEEMDAMLMVQVFSVCWKLSAKTFTPKFAVFFVPSMFSAPLCLQT